eukprot:scaffold11852_cov106-Isochrysis_galbana.AAC.2
MEDRGKIKTKKCTWQLTLLPLRFASWVVLRNTGRDARHRRDLCAHRNQPGHCLSPLATDAAGQLDVLGHDGDALGVDGAQVGVLEEAHKALERELADQELGRLLVPADLTERDGAWAVAVGLLDAACGRGRLAGGLGGQLLPGRLAAGGLARGLLGAGHGEQRVAWGGGGAAGGAWDLKPGLRRCSGDPHAASTGRRRRRLLGAAAAAAAGAAAGPVVPCASHRRLRVARRAGPGAPA